MANLALLWGGNGGSLKSIGGACSAARNPVSASVQPVLCHCDHNLGSDTEPDYVRCLVPVGKFAKVRRVAFSDIMTSYSAKGSGTEWQSLRDSWSACTTPAQVARGKSHWHPARLRQERLQQHCLFG